MWLHSGTYRGVCSLHELDFDSVNLLASFLNQGRGGLQFSVITVCFVNVFSCGFKVLNGIAATCGKPFGLV